MKAFITSAKVSLVILSVGLIGIGAILAVGIIVPAPREHPRVASEREEIEPTRITANGSSCGVERWAVKTLADPGTANVNFGFTHWTNIAALDALHSDQPTPREAPVETNVYGLAATHLIAFKLEGDSDIHLVLRSVLPGNPTMIAEIPSASCLTPGPVPAEQTQIGATRAAFLNCMTKKGLTLSTSFTNLDMTARIRGVGFFDFNHGQTGVAPNAIELHPALSFAPSYGTTC